MNLETDTLAPADAGIEPDPVDADLEGGRRLWLRSITPLLQLRSHDPDPSPRVQLAFDLMHIAACERIARILGGDLPDGREIG